MQACGWRPAGPASPAQAASLRSTTRNGTGTVFSPAHASTSCSAAASPPLDGNQRARAAGQIGSRKSSVPCATMAATGCQHVSGEGDNNWLSQERSGARSRRSCSSRRAAAPGARRRGRAAVSTRATAEMAIASTTSAVAAPVGIKLVAVVLGYLCFLGSCFRSLPQILKVVRNNSTEGLSLTSNIIQLMCYTVMVAYNVNKGYPFSTFGEVFACWVQDIVMVSLILWHQRVERHVAATLGLAFFALCTWLLSGWNCPMGVLSAMQLSTIFIMGFGSRLPQILLNMQRGNAGVMSVTTCIMNVAGNLVRIFVTCVVTHDMLILAGGCSQLVLNSILLYQAAHTALSRAGRSTFGFSSSMASKPSVETAAAAAVAAAAAAVGGPSVEGLRGGEYGQGGEPTPAPA